MKKQYTAPKSENVNLDPLMVSFLDSASLSVAGAQEGAEFKE